MEINLQRLEVLADEEGLVNGNKNLKPALLSLVSPEPSWEDSKTLASLG
jgi:hypothetical protein